MLVLIAAYLLIALFILLFYHGGFGGRFFWKKMWTAIVSGVDMILWTAAFFVYQQQIFLIGLLIPAIAFISAIWEIGRESKIREKMVHFYIPENSYEVKHNLSMYFIPDPRIRSVTGIIWEGKVIAMPQPFSCKGEALELICIKIDEKSEKYQCREVKILNRRPDLWKGGLTGVLTVCAFGFPTCLFLAVEIPARAAYWNQIGIMFFACAVFGFAWLLTYGGQKRGVVRVFRAMAAAGTILSGICLLGAFAGLGI